MRRYGPTVVAVPTSYRPEFLRDAAGALLQYGSLPQRARMPFFTNAHDIDRALVLPDVVTGPRAAALTTAEPDARTLVADRDVRALIDGLAPTFHAPPDGSFWHLSADLALNTKRHGDRAGVALGRIARSEIEWTEDPFGQRYERVVRTFEVPLVAQIAAPPGDQIYLGAITRLVLALKRERGFNITSFSMDGYQSANQAQELVGAGLVTAGMHVEDESGEITGTPKPFSVDGRSTQPYRELLEACAEGRVALPRYPLLRNELRGLEVPDPSRAPDHSAQSSKDCGDAVAAVLGYLSAFGHAELVVAGVVQTDRGELESQGAVEAVDGLALEEEEPSWGEEESLSVD